MVFLWLTKIPYFINTYKYLKYDSSIVELQNFLKCTIFYQISKRMRLKHLSWHTKTFDFPMIPVIFAILTLPRKKIDLPGLQVKCKSTSESWSLSIPFSAKISTTKEFNLLRLQLHNIHVLHQATDLFSVGYSIQSYW